ncbi:YolD-like protein [Bacillus oleivorans]|uniref:YolD-like protein n=1 Tax=Bacillus oleivorans TaxID=1448271 RepID=A0A285CKC1_9BACI|nr:YolD-like family protein [Bacillus oleivorans]SNX68034.1 YolD-like protein [Bacillus oleivorans]
MLRDRGRIKWTSMMLPEHVKLLRDWAEEDKYETPKELDEQQLEHMNQLLEEAIASDYPLLVTYFENHHYQTVKGQVYKVDPYQHRLYLKGENEEVVLIPFERIGQIAAV